MANRYSACLMPLPLLRALARANSSCVRELVDLSALRSSAVSDLDRSDWSAASRVADLDFLTLGLSQIGGLNGAVHGAPEVALERTNFRFINPENGRGASISVISDIQAKLPAGLRQIQQRYSECVNLSVLKNNPIQQKSHAGWDNISFLEKEGNHQPIKQRLNAALDRGYRQGHYSAGFYTQAAGADGLFCASGGTPHCPHCIQGLAFAF